MGRLKQEQARSLICAIAPNCGWMYFDLPDPE